MRAGIPARSQAGRDNSHLVLATLCLGLAIGIAFLGAYIYRDDFGMQLGPRERFGLLLLGLIVILVIATLRARLWRPGLDLAEPPIYIAWTYILLAILPNWLNWDNPQYFYSFIMPDYEHYLTLALTATGAALLSMWVGYAWMAGRVRPYFRTSLQDDRYVDIGLLKVIWLSTMAVRLGLIMLGVRGHVTGGILEREATLGLDRILNIVEFLNPMALVALTIEYLRRPRRCLRIWVWGMIVVSISYYLTFGSRNVFIAPLLALFCLRYVRNRYPWQIVIILVLLGMELVPIGTQVRYSGADIEYQGLLTPFVALGEAVRQVAKRPLLDTFNDGLATITGRQAGYFQIVASVMYFHPQIYGYRGLDKLLYVPLSFIPRLIWRSKPIDTESITELYTISSQSFGSTAITIFGDLYRMGGWLVLTIAMFLYGMALGWIYGLTVGTGTPEGIVWFLTMGPMVFMHNGRDVSGMLIDTIQYGIVIWLVISKMLYSKRLPMSRTTDGG